jgi:hypothetical protein
VVIAFRGPIVLLVASLSVFYVKIGGTVQDAVHGWPYGLLVHHLNDVLSNDRIDRWSLFTGMLFWRVIAGYLFYFTIFLTVRFFVMWIEKNRMKKKSYRVAVCYLTFILLALALTAVPSFRYEAVQKKITHAQACTQDEDCIDIGSYPAFSCWVVVNRKDAQDARRALQQIPEQGDELSCQQTEKLKAICGAGRCTMELR